MSGPVIYLVRHGETEWNLARRYQGWSDPPLTERGLAQAEAIGRLLCGLPEAHSAPLVASPIGRARRTAQIIRQCLGRSEPLEPLATIHEWKAHDRLAVFVQQIKCNEGGGQPFHQKVHAS